MENFFSKSNNWLNWYLSWKNIVKIEMPDVCFDKTKSVRKKLEGRMTTTAAKFSVGPSWVASQISSTDMDCFHLARGTICAETGMLFWKSLLTTSSTWATCSSVIAPLAVSSNLKYSSDFAAFDSQKPAACSKPPFEWTRLNLAKHAFLWRVH